MKKEGSLKSILAILVIILLCLVSFGGIYVKNKNSMKNILPEYVLGMDLDTNTILKLDVVKNEESSSENTQEETNENQTESSSTEQNENESNESTTNENETVEQGGQAENIYTLDNYKKAKNIIEKRLNEIKIQQYTIRLDEQSGSIILEVPDDVDTSKLRNAYQTGKFEIVISETKEVIADNNSISKVETSIDNTYENYFGSIVKINMEFTADAVKKFKEVKNNYVVPTDEDGNQTENTVLIYIDGSNIFGSGGMNETEFLDTVINGTLPLSMGTYTTDKEVLEETLEVANNRKVLMENSELPIEYTASYADDVHTNIGKSIIVGVFGVLAFVMIAYIVIKYKFNGVLAGLNLLGFGALLLLVLRLTNVQISIATLVSIAGILILQFIYLIRMLSSEKITDKVFGAKTLEYTKILIPAFIMCLVIAFANIIEISGFGMVIFWGIILFEIFNNIITRAILTNVKNK